MKFLDAAVTALVVALTLVGCGGSSSAPVEVVNIDLPAARPADAVIPAVVPASRRINAHRPPAASHAPTVITPLTPRANARLSGVSVWVPYWSLDASIASAVDNAGIVKVAHPFLDEITGTDTVVDQSGGQSAAVTAQLDQAHLDVIPTVTETASMGAFAATLTHPKRLRGLLGALESIAGQPGVGGIDLDFENLAYGSGNPHQADTVEHRYPMLVAQLCAALHEQDRSCEVTVMAKNTGGLQDGDGLDTNIYDYAALAQVADRVQIMAYDDHVPSSAPGPIAPWPWVESVLDYALTQIPADKIVLGVPAYGYDWSSQGGATSLTAPAAEALAGAEHAHIDWNATDAEPYFTYATGRRKHRVHHVVWFDDATADYDRAVLAADDKLAGIALWAAGDEDPSTWSLLGRLGN